MTPRQARIALAIILVDVGLCMTAVYLIGETSFMVYVTGSVIGGISEAISVFLGVMFKVF